ncbi:MAG: amino acid adenylation domain-containing protein, partial [Cytophagales bacterium]|nr:amino acid adenylation domain-containing protein [Cytophagales bacterium]
VVPEAEKRRLLEEFNNTRVAYNGHVTLPELFEQRVTAQPDRVALGCGEASLTYAELNKRANQLAAFLVGNGVGTGSLVGVVMSRSPEMIIAVMGILKAGGAYIPVEPHWPLVRAGRILDSLGAAWLLTNEKHLAHVRGIGQQLTTPAGIICLDVLAEGEGAAADWRTIAGYGGENLAGKPGADDLAYIIHTSGSTGLPKGVAVRHKPVVNLIEWVNTTFNVSHADKMLFVSSLAFDLSVYDIFGILAAGGAVCIAPEEAVRDGQRLLGMISREKITFWDSAPAALQQLVALFEEEKPSLHPDPLRVVFLSGDWIPLTMPAALQDRFPNAQVVALGGATEAAIWSNYFPVGETNPAWNSIPYGKPIQNARYYIADPYLNLCPIGVAGDLYIGGDCLASGYANEVELTAGKFIKSPFEAEGTLYRTGDCARWGADGNMEFLGRKDSQVKIRGMRIELGEVQHQLTGHPAVRDAIVVTVDRAGDKHLCAYFTASGVLESDALKEYLAKELPNYMIPAFFVQLTQFPVTANGKLDRNALPAPAVSIPAGQVQPTDETERELLKIFAGLLNLEERSLGTENDFFELGGHSLKATQLIMRISRTFDVKLDLRDVFLGPTVREIARKVRASAKTYYAGITPVAPQPHYEVSHAQKGMWITCQLTKHFTAFNVSMAYRLTGPLNREALGKAFGFLLERHEIMRTTFALVDGTLRQQVHPLAAPGFHLEYFDPEALAGPAVEEAVEAIKSAQENTVFDLANGPLIRAALVAVAKHEHVFVFTLHHIITDGWSMDILLRELLLAYRAYCRGATPGLPALEIQYKDYAAWQNQRLAGAEMEAHKKFWHNQLGDGPAVLQLPADYERSAKKAYSGSRERFALNRQTIGQLHELGVRHKTTLFITLVAFVKTLLHKYSGQQDITIGAPVAGRDHLILEGQMGLFVNMLALRTRFADREDFDGALGRVKRVVLDAFAHQHYPFDQLIDDLKPEVQPGHSPLFDVIVNLHMGSGDESEAIEGLGISRHQSDNATSKYDLSFNFAEDDGNISLTIEYNSCLYKSATIGWLGQNLFHLVERAAGDPGANLDEIELLSPAEEKQEVEEFLQAMRNL